MTFDPVIVRTPQNRFPNAVGTTGMRSANIRNEIELDVWVMMPNHIHGSVIIRGAVGATGRSPLQLPHGPSKRSLGALIAGFKSITTKRINELRQTPGVPFWQRNYYEHVIRDEKSLNNMRNYILVNPLLWRYDRENPNPVKPLQQSGDRMLAQHYGFTDEESDFIINYNLKYWMGQEDSQGEEAEEALRRSVKLLIMRSQRLRILRLEPDMLLRV